MRRNSYFITIIILVFLMAVSACTSESQDEDGSIRASGFVEGRSFSVVSPLGGRISRVQVEQGDEVDRGEGLITLNDDDYQHLHGQAQAGVQAAEAGLAAIDELPLEEDIKRGEGLVAVAEAELEGAIAALDLLESIYSPRDVPEAELHEAESAVAIAGAGVELAKAQLAQIRAGPLEGERKMAAASLREAQSQLGMIERQMEELSITSPATGIVEDVLVREGEIVVPGSPVARVLDPSFLTIKVYVPENKVALLKIGDEVEITADAYPEEIFQGSVHHIADRAQFTPTLVLTEDERVKLVFEVEVIVEEGLDRLKPGMPVDVEIKT